MIPISILLPRQQFWSHRAIKTCAVDALIGEKSSEDQPLIGVHFSHPPLVARRSFFLFFFVTQTRSPALHKCALHPHAPLPHLSASSVCPIPFPSPILTSVAPPRRCSSAQAAFHTARLPLSHILLSSQRKQLPYLFIVSLFLSFFTPLLLFGGGGLMYKTWCLR